MRLSARADSPVPVSAAAMYCVPAIPPRREADDEQQPEGDHGLRAARGAGAIAAHGARAQPSAAPGAAGRSG